MSDENSKEIDLWGNETFVVKRTRGRPKFERTRENALKVSMLVSMGWTNDRIADVILDPRTGKSISKPTLKRHFRAELAVRDQARDLLRARQLMLAFAAAEAGNVGAMRLFDQLVEKNDLLLNASLMPKGTKNTEADVKQPVLGKKAQAFEDAEDAIVASDDDWGDDLQPGAYRQ